MTQWTQTLPSESIMEHFKDCSEMAQKNNVSWWQLCVGVCGTVERTGCGIVLQHLCSA